MLLPLLIGVFLALLSGIAYLLHKHNVVRKVRLAAGLPGPSGYPLIGNGLLFLNRSASENFTIVCNLVRDYGPVCRVWIGPDLNVLLSNTKDVEQLLSSSKTIDKSSEYKYIRPWLSEGLLLSSGKKWYKRRKIITPAFHFSILEEYVEVFDRQAETLIRTLATFGPKAEVELYPIVTLYALDVICEASMGTTVNAQKNSNSEYVLAVKEMSHVIHLRMFDIILRIDELFAFSGLYRKMHSALRILHGFTDRVIQERRLELIKSRATSAADATNLIDLTDTMGIKRKQALLDILLQATIDDRPLSDLEIREEVDTFMFEGHDTTTSAITFCLYRIARHPEVQRKCVEEIRRVMGDRKGSPITLQQLSGLHYLELVIKETLRLYPSVPLIGRELIDEVTINGHTYPAGCNIIVPIFSIGRDPKLFSDPLEFRPERHDVEQKNHDKFDTFAYVPFSAGPRNCIGQKFAMLELKSVLSRVLRNFELSLAAGCEEEPEMLAELILVPASKIKFHLTERLY